MSLSRDQILASLHDRKPERVEVPEWGGHVYVRALTVRDQMELAADGQPERMPLRVLIHSIVDEDGAQILTEDDMPALEGEHFRVIMRLFQVSSELNGLTNAEVEEAEAAFVQAPLEATSTE